MKKIFLLTLLSVFLLSAFSQTLPGGPEIITKINITKTAEFDDEDDGEFRLPDHGWWIFFWRTVITIPTPDGGYIVQCYGRGWRICIIRPERVMSLMDWCMQRGIDRELVERSYESLYDESDERIANGEYRGSISKKIAFQGDQNGARETYLLFQMNWEHNPRNPRNGKAEIIISTTNKLGF